MIQLDVTDQLLESLVRCLEQRPELAQRLRVVLGTDAATAMTGAGPTWMTVDEYADHTRYSKRTVESLIARGLPLVGSGRLRRVPVAEADLWLRQQDQPKEQQEIEARAREAARAKLAKPRIVSSLVPSVSRGSASHGGNP